MPVLDIGFKEAKVLRFDNRDYTLVFGVAVVAELEEKLGRSMKSALDWLKIQTKEVEAIIEAGMSTKHPEESREVARGICGSLDPEEIETVIDALCVAAFPKAMVRLKEHMDKAREAAKKGHPLPNAESVAVS